MTQPSNLLKAASETMANGQAPAKSPISLSDRVRSLRLQTDGANVKPPSAWLPWGVTFIALALAGLFGWRAYLLSPEDRGNVNASASAGEGTDSSSVGKPALSPDPVPGNSPGGEVVLDSKGYVIAAHQIQLSPQVGGEIIWLDPKFREGAVYRKGEVLAKIDPVIYEARQKSAEAALRVAEVNLMEFETGSALQEIKAARAQLRNLSAKLELTRIDERNKRRANLATSRDEMEKAGVQIVVDQTALDAQQENLNRLEVSLKERVLVAKAQLLKGQADLQEATKTLKNCVITAPTSGIVLSKKAELGGYVNPLAPSATGYLCEMADLRDLEIELDIQERDIGRIHTGQRCRIMPEAGQHDESFLKSRPEGYVGVVSRRMPVANRSKGAITVRVQVKIPEQENGGDFLLPDMSALVSFLKDGK